MAEPIIRLAGITKTYGEGPTAFQALKGVDLDIMAGDFIAVMGASGAVGFVYRKQLKEAASEGKDVDALRLELQQDYEDTLVNPYVAAERGYVDAVIPPSHTRGYIGTALRLLERKIAQVPPKKHGNIPL